MQLLFIVAKEFKLKLEAISLYTFVAGMWTDDRKVLPAVE